MTATFTSKKQFLSNYVAAFASFENVAAELLDTEFFGNIRESMHVSDLVGTVATNNPSIVLEAGVLAAIGEREAALRLVRGPLAHLLAHEPQLFQHGLPADALHALLRQTKYAHGWTESMRESERAACHRATVDLKRAIAVECWNICKAEGGEPAEVVKEIMDRLYPRSFEKSPPVDDAPTYTPPNHQSPAFDAQIGAN